MQKLIIILLISTCAGSFSTPANFDSANETKNILILFSLVPTTPAYRTILDGIRLKLSEEYGDTYRLHQEYLETDRFTDESYQKGLFELFNEKYKELDIDLLILVGINIIPTVKKYAAEYILDLPTVSLDYDFSNYGFPTEIKLNNKTAAISLKLNAEKSIATALSLFPNIETVYFICGASSFDKIFMEISKKAAEKTLKGKNTIFITDVEMDDLLRQVRDLPENSLIFIPNFIRDKKMIPYFNPEAIRLIRREANLPVFNFTDTGFGDGSIGGYVISFEKIGPLTGETVVKVLNGVEPNSIQINESDYYSYLFDWRELKRWNIDRSTVIPAESIIKFKEFNFFDEYKWTIGAALLFIVLQTLLIANLVRLNKNQKIMTQKIIESENRYREFVHEDRILRLGQLTASLSHELNQPLTAILSNAQAGINLINSNQATPELLKEIFQKIVDNDKRSASVLRSIRGMLKLESREKEKTDLNPLIEEVVGVFRSEAKKQSIKIFIHLLNEPVYIFADVIQIQQVILNFLTNASQSMNKSNIQNKIIEINQIISEDDVTVSVRDYGLGIDESILAKVFNPFVTSKSEGMGIGLAICRSIVEDHGGKISAENMPEGGAKFSFNLKIFKDD